MINEERIALIYFSRHATKEGRSKSWFSSKFADKNRALASTLIHQSSTVLRESGFPVFHYHEENQTGNTFGERIANACYEVFSLGYKAVITVGNDCPEMGKLNWRSIRQELAAGKCVVGPSLRKGAYLIGITKEVFNKEGFQHLPWQTNKLLDALLIFCTCQQDKPYVLASLRDINSWHDLKKLLKSSHLSSYVRRVILSLLSSKLTLLTKRLGHFLTSPILSDSPFRAPPTAPFTCFSR